MHNYIPFLAAVTLVLVISNNAGSQKPTPSQTIQSPTSTVSLSMSPNPAILATPTETALQTKLVLLEHEVSHLNNLASGAGAFLALFLALGTAGSFYSLYHFERRTKEAHGLSMRGEGDAQKRAAEVHQGFLEGSKTTLELVNATLTLAKEAGERAAKFLEERAREELATLNTKANRLLTEVSQSNDRALIEKEQSRSKLRSLAQKIGGFEINRFVLPREFKLTPSCFFIRGMDFHLDQLFEDAIENWRKVAEDDSAEHPLRSMSWYWIGYENNNLGHFLEAVKNFEQALVFAKGSRIYELKRIRLESRFFAEEPVLTIISQIETLLTEIDNDTKCDREELIVRRRKTTITLGNLYHVAGDDSRVNGNHEEATKYYTRALEQFERVAKFEKWARFGCGEALFRLERTEEAIALFRDVVKQDAVAESIDRVEPRTKALARATELLCCVRVPEWRSQILSMHSQVVEALGYVGEQLTVYSQIQRRNVTKDEFKKAIRRLAEETVKG